MQKDGFFWKWSTDSFFVGILKFTDEKSRIRQNVTDPEPYCLWKRLAFSSETTATVMCSVMSYFLILFFLNKLLHFLSCSQMCFCFVVFSRQQPKPVWTPLILPDDTQPEETTLSSGGLDPSFLQVLAGGGIDPSFPHILGARQLREGGFQRDVVYLGWPIAPSYMSPNAGVMGGGGGLRGLSQWVLLYTGAQINLGDPTPYLTCGWEIVSGSVADL
jgi:hypothetical protein